MDARDNRNYLTDIIGRPGRPIENEHNFRTVFSS